jgi:alkyl sulfatase BDS1-like metallo-beta-lactamase superfamily hydrolase
VIPATASTRTRQAALLDALPFGDTTDLELAERGLLAPLPDVVTTADGGSRCGTATGSTS